MSEPHHTDWERVAAIGAAGLVAAVVVFRVPESALVIVLLVILLVILG